MADNVADELEIDHGLLIQWVNEAEDATDESRALSEKCRDYYDSKQWTDPEIKKLKTQKQAPTVSNRIKPKIDSLMGMETTNRTTAKAFPRTQKHQQASEAATESIRFVLQDNIFEKTRSSAFENMLIEGIGGCEVIVKPVKDEFKVIINQIPWDRMFFDPHSRRKDFSDARYLGQIVWMDFDEALELYPEGEDHLNTMSAGATTFDDKPRWLDSKRKRVKIVELYYRKDGDVWYSCFTRSGFLKEPKVSPYKDEEDNTEWPYEFASPFVDREGGRYGAVRQLLDMQDEINKRRSKALHLMSVRQVRGERGAVEDVNKARQELAKPDGYIETTPGMEFEVLKTGDMAAAQFNLLTEAKQEIDAVGANAALMGKTTNQDASGRALLAREAAGKTELAPVFDTLKGWDYKVYKKIWNRIHQYWKAEKWIRVTDDEQNLRWVGLNKPTTKGEVVLQKAQEQNIPPEQLQQLQQQIASNPAMKEIDHTHNDVVEMDVDIVLDDVPDAITSQIEDFQTLGEMVKSGFPIPPLAVIEASPLTNKSKILKMMKEQPQIPQQIRDQMKKMQEELQKTTQENQQLKAGTQAKMAQIQADTQASGVKMQLHQQETAASLAHEREANAARLQFEREKASQDLQLQREKAQQEADLLVWKAKLEAETKVLVAQIAAKQAGDQALLEAETAADVNFVKDEGGSTGTKPKIRDVIANLADGLKNMQDNHQKGIQELAKAHQQSTEKLLAHISKPRTITAKSSSGATLTAVTH